MFRVRVQFIAFLAAPLPIRLDDFFITTVSWTGRISQIFGPDMHCGRGAREVIRLVTLPKLPVFDLPDGHNFLGFVANSSAVHATCARVSVRLEILSVANLIEPDEILA